MSANEPESFRKHRTPGLYLFRIDSFNLLRALTYGITALLVVLAGAALLDAFGADLLS